MKLVLNYLILLVIIIVFVKGQNSEGRMGQNSEGRMGQNSVGRIGQKNHAFFSPEAQNSIRDFVAVNVLSYIPPSYVIDNVLKKFFAKLERETLFATQMGLKPNVSAVCLTGLRDVVAGLKEMRIWALEMVDSFGKIPSGLLEGSVNAFGDYDQCINVNVPEKFQGRYCRIAARTPKKKTEYQSSKFTPIDMSFAYKRNSSKTLLEMVIEGGTGGYEYFPMVTSICVPSTCSEEDVGYLLALVTKPSQQILNVTVQHCMIKKELHLTPVHKTMIAAMMTLVLLEVFATMVDFRICSIHPDEEYRSSLKLWKKCLLSFSFRSNAIRLFRRDENPDSIKVFHGMKFITMIWIILGHTILYNVHALSRLVHGVKMFGGFFFQIPGNPFAGPDTFFFISGFLVVYSYVKLGMPKMSFVYYALYRYWRLVPPLMFIVGCLILSVNFVDGPMFQEYIVEELFDHCKTLWWKNLLCINNYGGVDGQCMPWTWYVAVDFQLYLLTYFLLIILRKNPKRVIFIARTLIVASVFYLMAFYVYYDLPPQPFLIYFSPEASKYYTKIAHYRPDPHISSYCIGILMGYYTVTQKKLNLTRNLKILGWLVSTLFGVLVVFGTYLWNSGRVATMLESVLYGGFYRLLWCLMIAWITYMCVNENGGIVRLFLSWRGFVPLGRLTYMAYLLHPIIIMISFGRLRHTIASDNQILVLFFLSFTFISYFLGFIFCMICEAPFTALLSVLISSKIGKTGVYTIKKIKEIV